MIGHHADSQGDGQIMPPGRIRPEVLIGHAVFRQGEKSQKDNEKDVVQIAGIANRSENKQIVQDHTGHQSVIQPEKNSFAETPETEP